MYFTRNNQYFDFILLNFRLVVYELIFNFGKLQKKAKLNQYGYPLPHVCFHISSISTNSIVLCEFSILCVLLLNGHKGLNISIRETYNTAK